MSNNLVLDNVNVVFVQSYLEKFNNDERYSVGDLAVEKLFKTYPKNTSLEDVLLKVCILNDMYSTNIYGTFKMAKHIVSLDLDKDLQLGNPKVVDKIAENHGLDRKFFSFATKYCSWHNPNKYCIYDSFVEKVLVAYKKKDNFSNFKKDDLKSAEKFMKVINDFRVYYHLENFSLKQLDKFLWMYGKEKFPNNYKGKKSNRPSILI